MESSLLRRVRLVCRRARVWSGQDYPLEPATQVKSALPSG